MINIIISSYGEPNATSKAIDCFLSQKTKEKFQITIIDPFPKTEEFLNKKYKNKINFFLDPGEGKSYALNIFLERIFSKDKKDIIILSDGDVYVSENAIEEIIKSFKDEKVGCISGKPTSLNSRKNKFGYWSHLLFDGIDKVRRRLSYEKRFFEASGYLYAIRNGIMKGFSLESADDIVISDLFWKKGYKIKYLSKVEVYVLNPQNWKDYKIQKIRNIKAHENVSKVSKKTLRTKSFFNEIKQGFLFSIKYPKNLKEFIWTLELIFTRLYIYLITFYEIKLKKQTYSDGWRRDEIKSTKPLD